MQAAPMDKDDIEDLIRRCFEADNNGEVNFLSFWAGELPNFSHRFQADDRIH